MKPKRIPRVRKITFFFLFNGIVLTIISVRIRILSGVIHQNERIVCVRLPGGMCLRSSCTLDRHPAVAVADCLHRSSSDGRCSSGDAATTIVSGAGRTSMTRPHVSTSCTVLSSVACSVVTRSRSAAVRSAGCPPRTVSADCGRTTAVVPQPRTPPPFRCGHDGTTLPRGILL